MKSFMWNYQKKWLQQSIASHLNIYIPALSIMLKMNIHLRKWEIQAMKGKLFVDFLIYAEIYVPEKFRAGPGTNGDIDTTVGESTHCHIGGAIHFHQFLCYYLLTILLHSIAFSFNLSCENNRRSNAYAQAFRHLLHSHRVHFP